MAVLLANDFPILSGHITFPRVGVWSAVVVLDGEELSGTVSITTEQHEVVWKGSVLRGSTFLGRAEYLVLGGAASLHRQITPKFYEGSPLRLPVQDLLSSVGEVLSPSSDQESLSFLLQKWTSTLRSAGSLLTLLCSNVDGLIWRVLPSGEVWVGKDAYTPFTDDFVLLREDALQQTAYLDVDLPTLQPGTKLETKKIDRVLYSLEGNKMETKVWYEI